MYDACMMHVILSLHGVACRLLLKVQHELDEGFQGQGPVNIWSEFIADLWKKHLPHLREEIYGEGLFVYNPNTGRYGFQEEEEEEEDSAGELMAVLLREAAEEDEEEGKRVLGSGLQPESSFAMVSESKVGHTYDLNQHSSEEEEEEEEEGEEEREGKKHDPEVASLTENCMSRFIMM